MALFQPTNIIPSSFTVGVVDAEKDVAKISWQVNGNSAMTAFEIKFYQNNTDTTAITSTGRQNIAGGFYGTDRFGQPKIYTWTAPENKTWGEFFAKFKNGEQYKFKIEQYWQEGGEEKSIEQLESSVFIMRSTPSMSIQRSPKGDFASPVPFPSGSTLPASIGYFVGDYSQEQGAPVREVRWQVATWVNGEAGEILADTGVVDTPTLEYSFNGFFIGNEYAVRCFGKSDYQTYGTQDFDSGWTYFTAKIPDDQKQSEYTGNFTAQCLPNENAVLLQWEGVEVIRPSFAPDDFQPAAPQGSVTLPAKRDDVEYSITWDKQNADPMNFPAPWSLAWKGRASGIKYYKNFAAHGNLGKCLFSPNGKLLLIGDDLYTVNGMEISYVKAIESQGDGFSDNAVAFSPDGKTAVFGTAIYSVNGTEFTYISEATREGIGMEGAYLHAATFSPDGKLLVVGGAINYHNPVGQSGLGSNATIFSVDGTEMTYIGDIAGAERSMVMDIAFSPDGKLLVVGGNGSGLECTYYSVNGTKVAKIGTVMADTTLKDVYSIAFSPDGKLLVIGGNFKQSYVFSVSGTTLNYISDLPTCGISGKVLFDPSGKTLVLGVLFENLNVYSVDGTTFTHFCDLEEDKFDEKAVFSPDGTSFIFYGRQSSKLFVYKWFYPVGKLSEVKLNDGQKLSIQRKDFLKIEARLNDTVIASADVQSDATHLAAILTPSQLIIYSYGENISRSVAPASYSQKAITSVAILGADSGTTVDSVAVFRGSVPDSLYQDPDFKPIWNSVRYEMYMAANFDGNFEGGTGTASGDGFRIYRQEVGSDILTPIATLNSTETSLKDFGLRSRKAYKYSLCAYDSNGAFMVRVENDTVVATCFKNYSLLVCDYNRENDAYHVRKQYLFALNLSEGSVGNNNSPTLSANFTPYPTRMPSTQNYASGTLQGLIGAIYTVPALIEQIGEFRHTAKPSTIDYFDSVDLEKELYDLSVTPYTLFLRDMKGHLRMVATSGAITMTQDLKKRQLSTTISLPWVEVGDASDVTIIQTKGDYGWDVAVQELDVRPDRDPATGLLAANYPKPYDGTKFYLTSKNTKKED